MPGVLRSDTRVFGVTRAVISAEHETANMVPRGATPRVWRGANGRKIWELHDRVALGEGTSFVTIYENGNKTAYGMHRTAHRWELCEI